MAFSPSILDFKIKLQKVFLLVIAPFWTNVFDSDVWYRVTTNNDIIQRVSEDVASAFPELTTFSATEVLIVTWDNVRYFCSSEEVSFNFI